MDKRNVLMKAAAVVLGGMLAFAAASAKAGTEHPVRIVVLGDSLSAGYELPEADAFPAQLQKLLEAKGAKVEIVNAGVSGDTASDGLARVDWSIPDDTDAVILELGANDALRAIDPKITREALDKILARLSQRGVKVLLAGMIAPLNLGPVYAGAFNPIYPELAQKYGALLYPFILDGVVGDTSLQLRDRMHPNREGAAVIAARILPSVEQLIAKVGAKS